MWALLLKNKALEAKVADLEFQVDQLKKLIFTSKSERFVNETTDASQLNLFNTEQEEVKAETESEPLTETINYERKKNKKRNDHPGRHPFPDHLEVVVQIIEPDFDTSNMVKIGEEVSEHLEFTTGSLKRIRTIRPKYADKTNEQFHIAKPPSRALNKSIAGNGLLAFLFVCKFVDHLPFYRLEQKFMREYQCFINRKTMGHWLKLVCALLAPLYEVLKQKILDGIYIQGDESPIKVLAYKKKWTKGKAPPKEAKRITQGYMWAYSNVELGLIVYDYQPGRSAEGPTAMLQDFTGYLQCDGYAVYDKIANIMEGIILVGCWAHLRRKFFDSLKSDAVRVNYVLSKIKAIYQIEAEMQEAGITDYDKIVEIRAEKTKPLFDELKQWAEEESLKVVSQTPIAKAITYLQNQWHKLIAVLEDGRLKLDNNLVENKFRALALGRKNYMFAGSHEAAKRIAMMYSFFATCKAHSTNTLEWLKQTLDVIRDHPADQLEELLPGYQK